MTIRTSADQGLERKGRRLRRSSMPLGSLGLVLVLAGAILIVSGATIVVGAVLVGLALAPLGVAIGLLLPGVVSCWAARQKPFAWRNARGRRAGVYERCVMHRTQAGSSLA